MRRGRGSSGFGPCRKKQGKQWGRRSKRESRFRALSDKQVWTDRLASGVRQTPQEQNVYRVSQLTIKHLLPIEPAHSRHHIEVSIPAQQWKTVLAAQSRNPKVIRWNRLSSLSQFDADGCIIMRSLFVNVEHSAVSHQTIQPPPIPSPIARSCDPEAIFPNCHDWKR